MERAGLPVWRELPAIVLREGPGALLTTTFKSRKSPGAKRQKENLWAGCSQRGGDVFSG